MTLQHVGDAVGDVVAVGDGGGGGCLTSWSARERCRDRTDCSDQPGMNGGRQRLTGETPTMCRRRRRWSWTDPAAATGPWTPRGSAIIGVAAAPHRQAPRCRETIQQPRKLRRDFLSRVRPGISRRLACVGMGAPLVSAACHADAPGERDEVPRRPALSTWFINRWFLICVIIKPH